MKQNISTQPERKFFFCPASDYLNQYSETGSHGLISYKFIRHLAKHDETNSIYAVVMASLIVDPIKNVKFFAQFKKSHSESLNALDSLVFYLISFVKFFRSKQFIEADVVHHLLPFFLGRSFNLFFLLRNRNDSNKKYVLGPIIGPHIDTKITKDEEYVFQQRTTLTSLVKKVSYSYFTSILLFLFGYILNKVSISTLKSADIVLFTDKHSFNYHSKYLSQTQKAIILDTGIDTDVFVPSPVFAVKDSRADDIRILRILFVGRLTKRKGCEYLLRAIHILMTKNPEIKLLCKILGVGPLQNELVNLVKKLNIEKYVVFLGSVSSNEQIATTYQSVDIVCLPALSETFTVTKEALCCGKPVIVTNVCSNGERINNGLDGFIVPPGDPNAIAEILTSLSKNRHLLQEMGENALLAREKYGWDSVIKKYVQVLESI